MVFLFQKLILANIKYKTRDNELLAIVEAFKIGRHFLKGFQHKVFIFFNHNNL